MSFSIWLECLGRTVLCWQVEHMSSDHALHRTWWSIPFECMGALCGPVLVK